MNRGLLLRADRLFLRRQHTDLEQSRHGLPGKIESAYDQQMDGAGNQHGGDQASRAWFGCMGIAGCSVHTTRRS